MNEPKIVAKINKHNEIVISRICPFEICILNQEPRKVGICKFAIIDDIGNPDCGYGWEGVN